MIPLFDGTVKAGYKKGHYLYISFIKTINIQSVIERNTSTITVRQLERFSMNSTVLCNIRLSVHRNVVNYKIQNIKRIKYISTVRARKPKLQSVRAMTQKIHYCTLLLLLLSLVYQYTHHKNDRPELYKKHKGKTTINV